MSGFVLSPGITPMLTDLFVLELPIALGVGFFAARGRGFEIVFAANLLLLGIIKAITDYADLPDLVVAVSGIIGGSVWLELAVRRVPRERPYGGLLAALGPLLVVVGAIKLTDFYDPFDLLLADAVIVAGAALWWYRRPRSVSSPDAAPS